MGLFQHVEGETAIIVERGVYRQVDVYIRDGILYAKSGSGFIKLNADGSTTKSHARLETLTWDGSPLAKTLYGALCENSRPGAKQLQAPEQLKLLGAPEEK